MAKKKTPIKTKKAPDATVIPVILPVYAPRDLIAVSIDQSLSSTGIALSTPLANIGDVRPLLKILYAGLPAKEYQHRVSGCEASLVLCEKQVAALKGSSKMTVFPIYTTGRWSSGPRKPKRLLLGAVIQSSDGLSLIASARIPSEPSPLPEWISSQRNAQLAADIVSDLSAYASLHNIPKMSISCESLAMGGSKLTARILPVLGVVWAMMFQAIQQIQTPSNVTVATFEFQISSWKKAFTTNGHADKVEVAEQVMKRLDCDGSLYAFDTSDESDAMAMVILLAAAHQSASASLGRLRPQMAGSET